MLSLEGEYPFASLQDKNKAPEPLLNPKTGDLTSLILDETRAVTSETQLLIYFVGHSVSLGKDDLQFILRTDQDGEHKRLSLSFLLRTIREATPIRKMIIILDSCHSGCAKGVMSTLRDDIFVMFASGSEYAFDANFSDCILKSLEQPLRKNDQRIDRRNGGITYLKLFEDARGRLLRLGATSGYGQYPECYGDGAESILRGLSIVIPKEYNEFAPRRSVYGRINHILQQLKISHIDLTGIDVSLRMTPLFLTRKSFLKEEENQYLSLDRLTNYMDLLCKIEWVILKKGIYKITTAGLQACDDLFFNELLLLALERKVFCEEVTFRFIDGVINDLLKDMIPPTPIHIQERAAMKGVFIRLDMHTRIALKILPMAGRFLKGSSDAIYPAEYRPSHA